MGKLLSSASLPPTHFARGSGYNYTKPSVPPRGGSTLGYYYAALTGSKIRRLERIAHASFGGNAFGIHAQFFAQAFDMSIQRTGLGGI